MKVLVEVAGVWIDPTAIAALWHNGQGATLKFVGSDAPLTIPDSTVEDVLDAARRAVGEE